MSIEEREEERRYEEAGREQRRELDRRLLEDPITVLQPRPPVVVDATESVAAIATRMADPGQGCVVIVDDEQRLTGIFTERDLLVRVVAPGRDPAGIRVGEVMTESPEFAMNEDTLGYALHKMALGRLRHLPVIDDAGRPIGLLTQREGVRYLAGFFPETVINQPPRSITQLPPQSQHGG